MSTPIRHVLAATDLSPLSLHAVDRALQLAAAHGARCTLMHALGLDPLDSLREWLGSRADELTRLAQAHQREALLRIAADSARNPGVAVEVHLEPGAPTRAVPTAVAALNPDLTVIGARGEGALRRVLVGSTASRLLRTTTCPLLLVRKPCASAYRRDLVAVDFSPASEIAIRCVRQLLPQAQLLLLHVLVLPYEGMLRAVGVASDEFERAREDARKDALRRMRTLAAAAGLDEQQCTLVVDTGDAAQRLALRAEMHGCDLIVAGKHGTHTLHELLIGSVTKRLVEEADVDMLVVVDHRPVPIA